MDSPCFPRSWLLYTYYQYCPRARTRRYRMSREHMWGHRSDTLSNSSGPRSNNCNTWLHICLSSHSFRGFILIWNSPTRAITVENNICNLAAVSDKGIVILPLLVLELCLVSGLCSVGEGPFASICIVTSCPWSSNIQLYILRAKIPTTVPLIV
jgi:hypothetical protein